MNLTASNPNASMTIIHAVWDGQPSFKLFPAELYSPYTEVIFDPRDRSMGVVSKEHKPKLMLLAKIDENGDPILRKASKVKSEEPYQLGRVQVDAFYEYFLANEADILAFVERHALNPDHEAFRHFFPLAHNPAGPAYTLGDEAKADPSFNSKVSTNDLIVSRVYQKVGEASLIEAPEPSEGPFISQVITAETATMALSDDELETTAHRQAA